MSAQTAYPFERLAESMGLRAHWWRGDTELSRGRDNELVFVGEHKGKRAVVTLSVAEMRAGHARHGGLVPIIEKKLGLYDWFLTRYKGGPRFRFVPKRNRPPNYGLTSSVGF